MADDDLDETIDGFVELEAELTSGSATTGEYHEGTVSGGTKVAAADVPDGYPASFDTDHALHLEVDVDGGATVDAFLPWPEPGSDADHLARLLDNLGIDADEFANVYGETVGLEPVDGWHRVDVAGTPPRGGGSWVDSGGTTGGSFGPDSSAFGSDTSETDSAPFDADSSTPEYYGEDDTTIAALLVPAVAVAIGAISWLVGMAGTVTTSVAVSWFLSLFAIPASLAYSAYATSERGGWDPNPLVWGLLGAVPLLNVPVGVGYLVEWVARGKPRAGPSRVWHWGVVGATLLSLGPLLFLVLFGGLSSGAGFESGLEAAVVTAWLYSPVLLMLSILFDTKHVQEGGDWDPTRAVWIAGAVPSALVFLGWFVGGAYLIKRKLELA